jgi:hypothetical protein
MYLKSLTLRLALITAAATMPATGQPALSDQEIAAIIVKESRDAYYRTGHPCACPEDLARNGSRCGRRSAYTRPGGAEPYCYMTDVPKEKVEAYRSPSRRDRLSIWRCIGSAEPHLRSYPH